MQHNDWSVADDGDWWWRTMALRDATRLRARDQPRGGEALRA
ncbi:MAG: hypothetical protein ACR2P7_01535 [bacterium]